MDKVQDHLGNEFKSITEMCTNWGVNLVTYLTRIKSGMSVKEALTKESIRKNSVQGVVIDHLGNEFDSIVKMCEAYGISYNTFNRRLNQGWSIEDTLTKKSRYPWGRQGKIVTDHLGNKFTSINKMCEQYNISTCVFRTRLENGWSLKDALEKPVYSRKSDYYDHLGNSYSTQKDMCKHYNISTHVFRDRIKSGWSLKDALERPIQTKIKPECRYDHLGNKYDTLKDMCDAYKISVGAYMYRIKSGLTLERALTTSLYHKKDMYVKHGNCGKSGKPAKDHLGNDYGSIKEMCDNYGINYRAYCKRLKNGWSLKETLERPLKSQNKVVDHLGNEYKTIKEMCENYGLLPKTYKNRLKFGWGIEKALTTPVEIHSEAIDHLGNEFNNLAEMCNFYEISLSAYKYRIANGWTKKRALTLPAGELTYVYDHIGNRFKSVEEMCKYHNISKSTYRYRIKHGKSKREALTGECNKK